MKDDEKKQEETYTSFKKLVNMTARQIEKWLEKDESNEVGQKETDGESTGRKSAKKIIGILHKKKDELNDGDYKHMGKVISYIKRHSAQRPEGEIKDTPWLYSLKNWGHDPQKKTT